MCQFKSAIVIKEPRNKGGFQLIMSPWTESHSELITINNLRDDGRLRFARVEFSPPTMDTAHELDRYKLKIDEERTPEWFTKQMKEDVAEKMRAYIKKIIITGDVALLIGGQFIIAPGAKIESAHTMIINTICGGTVNAIRGGTVNAIRGGTVNDICGGTVNDICGGTVNTIWGGTVDTIWGGTVDTIWGGTVNAIRGGTVNTIYGGTVNAIRGGTVNTIYGGTVNAIWGGTVKNDHRKKTK